MFLIIFLSLVLFYFYLRDWQEIFSANSFQDNFIKAILTSIIISLFVVLGERFFENHSTHAIVHNELNKIRKKINEDVANIFSTSFRFGLKEIQPSADEEKLIIDDENTKIMWLNTKFNRRKAMQDSIEKAIENGANVQLLLMHKDNFCANFRGMDSCSDHEDQEHVESNIRDYKNDLATNQNSMCDFYRRMQRKIEKENLRGSLEIRFYKDLPGIPFLLIEKGRTHNEAYSGFYLNRFSGGMLYIKWTSRGEGFIDNLYTYFERKWYFARDNDVNATEQMMDDIQNNSEYK